MSDLRSVTRKISADDYCRSREVGEHDQTACLDLILQIPSVYSSETAPVYRFANPTLTGLGAFGLVFSCVDRDQEGKRVAVKLLRPSRRNDQRARERFAEETRVTKSLRHSNIVEVYGSGYIADLPYIIAELADAGSIAATLHETNIRPTPRQAAWIVMQISRAVQEAHSNLILHRDIKPGNLLLRRIAPERSEGLGWWPLLTDFGLSKNLDQSNAPALTIQGEILGTLAYMSPEQVRGNPLKTQSDLFPLGIILHELSYGRHPFLGEDDFQTCSNIVNALPIKPSHRERRVPASLDAIIAKCLSKDPEDRYRHASDLAKDLEHYLHAKPISVSPPTPWQSFVNWIVTHPIASTCLVTIFGCALGSILIFNREWQVQRELARESQMVADDHAKMSKLFLESMRVTNSEINDTILSGQRVMPMTLLKSLDHQIPLLEKALSLAPGDHLLMRQLEIMYHYKSLCHAFACPSSQEIGFEEEYCKAVDARKKSLGFIDVLMKKFPNEQKFRISQINGQYFMGVLTNTAGDITQRWEWMDKAIANADAFLAKYPDQLDVLETSNHMRIERCASLAQDSPEYCVRELAQIVEVNLSMLKREPSRKTLLTYSALALSWESCILLQLDRDPEAFSAFSQLEALADEDPSVLQSHWHLVDYVFGGSADFCESLARKGCFLDILPIVERWQRRFSGVVLPDYMVIRGHRYGGSEFAYLFPMYYKWLALSELDPQSKESLVTAESLRNTIEQCRRRSEQDFSVFIQSIQEDDRKTAFQRFVAETSAGEDMPSD